MKTAMNAPELAHQSSVGAAFADIYGTVGDVARTNTAVQAVVDQFQAQVTEKIVEECRKEIHRIGKSVANWYLAFAFALESTEDMQADFIANVVEFATRVSDEEYPVDLQALEAAGQQAIELTRAAVAELRQLAARSH